MPYQTWRLFAVWATALACLVVFIGLGVHAIGPLYQGIRGSPGRGQFGKPSRDSVAASVISLSIGAWAMTSIPGIVLAWRGRRWAALLVCLGVTLGVGYAGWNVSALGVFNLALDSGLPNVGHVVRLFMYLVLAVAPTVAITTIRPRRRLDIGVSRILIAASVSSGALVLLGGLPWGHWGRTAILPSLTGYFPWTFALTAMVFAIGWDSRSVASAVAGIGIILVPLYGSVLAWGALQFYPPFYHPWREFVGDPLLRGGVLLISGAALLVMPLARFMRRHPTSIAKQRQRRTAHSTA